MEPRRFRAKAQFPDERRILRAFAAALGRSRCLPGADSRVAPPPQLAQKLTTRRGISRELTQLGETGPFEADIEMTPALGDIDGDDKTDIVVQPLAGGLIYCFEFDNSDYDSAINSKGWPCMGRNAARTHCAD